LEQGQGGHSEEEQGLYLAWSGTDTDGRVPVGLNLHPEVYFPFFF
jgi:hypothetical protein